jgi:hypothetical protein
MHLRGSSPPAVALAAALALQPAAAQCPVQTLVAVPHGASCSGGGTLSAAWFWPPFCNLAVTLMPPPFAVVPGLAWLAFGVSPQQTVYPPLGPCLLIANPIVVVPAIATYSIAVPPGLPLPFVFHAHGVGSYTDPVTGTTLLIPAQQGLQITLQ